MMRTEKKSLRLVGKQKVTSNLQNRNFIGNETVQ